MGSRGCSTGFGISAELFQVCSSGGARTDMNGLDPELPQAGPAVQGKHLKFSVCVYRGF